MQNGSFEENQDYIGFSPNTTTSNEMAQLKKRKLNDTMAVEEGEEIEFPRALQPVVQPDGPLKRFTHSAVSMPKTPSVRPPVISLRRQYMSLMVSEVPPWLRAYFTNRGVLQEYLSLPAVRQLHKEIVAFNQYISPTEKEKSERRDCVERIRSALQTVWPNAKVMKYSCLLLLLVY